MSYYSDYSLKAASYGSRIDKLEAAIRKHRDQAGDDRCWQDDAELYKILPEGYNHPKVDEPVMLENCKRYIERRQCPLTKYVPNLVEQAVHDLITRKAVHANKGTVMGEEKWGDIYEHLEEERDEFREAAAMNQYLSNLISTLKGATPDEDAALELTQTQMLEELGDIYGLIVHMIVKAGFTVRQVEDRELLKLKERYPDHNHTVTNEGKGYDFGELGTYE